MERDPLRLVWRASPGLCVLLVAIALVAGLPLVLAVLDLVRVAIEADAAGSGGRGSISLFRWALKLPDRISETPVTILRGITFERQDAPLWLAGGLAVSVVLAALLWWFAAHLAARIGRHVHDILIDRIGDGIASAPVGATDEARHASLLAGEALGQDRRALGFLPAAPVFAGSALVATVIWILPRDVESTAALLVALSAFSFTATRLTEARRALALSERGVVTSLQHALADVARNLSAVSRHGTQASERDRIASDMAPIERKTDQLEASATGWAAATTLLMIGAPVAVLAATLWASRQHGLSAGDAASCTLAAALAVAALVIHQWGRRRMGEIKPIFAELARLLGGFQSRRRQRDEASLPIAGPFMAQDVTTSPLPTGRLAGANAEFELPAAIALAGPRDGGARSFAAVLGGQMLPTRGLLTLAGQNLAEADPSWRAAHFAFAGGETYLFPGTLKANLLYGSAQDEAAEARLPDALHAAGLGRMIERRGLGGKIDPRREEDLAERVVAARRALRTALDEKGLAALVQPFDRERYNPQATIGENILFGAALGDTFREHRLPSQPFMRSLLDAEGLTRPLAAMGAEIARTTLEMFADLPEGPSIIGNFSLVSLADRDEIERVLGRREAGQRGATQGRDMERLIGLALRYCERRHRLGLLTPELEEQLIRVRKAFAEKLPKSLEPAVEAFEPERVCAAASLRDNLLFGRIADDRANAEGIVMREAALVLDGFGLTQEITRIGLGSRVEPVDPAMSMGELAAVELVRCLVRQPDNLVVEHALDHLPHAEAVKTARTLSEAMAGRGLVIAMPDAVADADPSLYAHILRFQQGRVVESEPPPQGRAQ